MADQGEGMFAGANVIRSVVFGSLALGLEGCASATRGSMADSGTDVQLSIFAAAVRGVMSTIDGTVTVKVDPRPIDVKYGPVLPDSTHYLAAEPSLVSARDSVVRDLGATTAAAFPLRRHCVGTLAAPSQRDYSGCPSQPEIVLTLAAEAKADQDEWTLPMISVSYGSRGRTIYIEDAIVIWNESGWVLDRLIRRSIWE